MHERRWPDLIVFKTHITKIDPILRVRAVHLFYRDISMRIGMGQAGLSKILRCEKPDPSQSNFEEKQNVASQRNIVAKIEKTCKTHPSPKLYSYLPIHPISYPNSVVYTVPELYRTYSNRGHIPTDTLKLIPIFFLTTSDNYRCPSSPYGILSVTMSLKFIFGSRTIPRYFIQTEKITRLYCIYLALPVTSYVSPEQPGKLKSI